MVEPISPQDLADEQLKYMPEIVIKTFNRLIAEKYNGHSSTVKQPDVMAALTAAGLQRSTIFEKGYLNVEDIYRKRGWKVSYDKPGYNEDYDAYFTFKKD